MRPAGGIYSVFVHGFETDEIAGGPGSNYRLLAWSVGTNEGNMSASGPAFVSPGTTADVTVDFSGLLSDTIYLGAISHVTPDGPAGLTILRIGN